MVPLVCMLGYGLLRILVGQSRFLSIKGGFCSIESVRIMKRVQGGIISSADIWPFRFILGKSEREFSHCMVSCSSQFLGMCSVYNEGELRRNHMTKHKRHLIWAVINHPTYTHMHTHTHTHTECVLLRCYSSSNRLTYRKRVLPIVHSSFFFF